MLTLDMEMGVVLLATEDLVDCEGEGIIEHAR